MKLNFPVSRSHVEATANVAAHTAKADKDLKSISCLVGQKTQKVRSMEDWDWTH